MLEILLINRTDTTLTNVTLELSTMGDLKLGSFTDASRYERH